MKSALSSAYQYDAERNLWSPKGKGERFGYSDGDAVENHIFHIIQSASDKSVASRELAGSIRDWATLYHLSADRSNIIRPIVDQLEGPILEIGSGCGAITRFLGEQGFEVVAVEGSARRGAIGAERCRDLPNVNVVAEPFQNFDIGRKFKTITLIGVLEYARMFYDKFEVEDPIDLMLKRIATLLEPDGKLIIAIENQIGLKYFAGFPEDHLNQPMLGIESRYTNKSAVTFGKKELGERMAAVGLGHHQWWYPFPDYKLPVSVLAEDALTDEVPADFTSLITSACSTDKQAPKFTTFSQDFAWKAIVRNGLAGDLSNSFLLIASAEEISKPQAIGFHYGGYRDPAFRKLVEFGKDDDGYYVERRRMAPDAVSTMDPGKTLSLSLGREEMRSGKLWRDELPYVMARDGWGITDVNRWADVWWTAFVREVHKHRPGINVEARTQVPGSLFDALPRNLIVDTDGQTHFIDQEWHTEGALEAGQMLYRALYDAFYGVRFAGQSLAGTPRDIGTLILAVAQGLGLSLTGQDLLRYLGEESRFQSIVNGRPIQIPPAVLAKTIPGRMMMPTIIQHLEQTVKTRDGEIAELVKATTEMQQKVSEFRHSLEGKLEDAHRLLREKDQQIATLIGARADVA
jgi:SAM-dependent methyltransferase